MKRHLLAGGWLLAAIGGQLFFAVPQSSGADLPAAVVSPTGLPWVRTFGDDFTSASGTLNGWTKELGTGSQYGLTGWGNSELESYTANTANLNISNGALNIVALVQNNGTNVTSARINTSGLFSQTYGLFQMTARLPAGTDLWPAFWTLPANNTYGGWPTSGEIDIMESGGGGTPQNKQVQGTYHSGVNYMSDQYQTASYTTSNDPTFNTTNFNTYDLLWSPASTAHPKGMLQWYVNGQLYETQTGGWYRPPGSGANGPYDQPFYMIINLAIGGPNTPFTGYQSPVDGTYTMQITDVEAFAFPTAGDLNRDGVVDKKDVSAMMAALTNTNSFAAAHSLTNAQLAAIGDVNGDGKFTNSDIQSLISKVASSGGGGSLSAVPEPGSWLLLVTGACVFWLSAARNRSRLSAIE